MPHKNALRRTFRVEYVAFPERPDWHRSFSDFQHKNAPSETSRELFVRITAREMLELD